jgi:peptide/nickel transport system substrate-binding protein
MKTVRMNGLVGAIAFLLVAPMAFAGAAKEKGVTADVTTEQTATGKYREAPELAELVKQGLLPPVEERLPDEPLVFRPGDEYGFESIGEYGGILRVDVIDAPGSHGPYYEQGTFLGGWFPHLNGPVLPNAWQGWEASSDNKTWTFFMRKGMKWSDGAPYTVDDFFFWYEDIVLNKELSPTAPAWTSVPDDPPVVQRIDDYTFRVQFNTPRLNFQNELAHPRSVNQAAKHYLMQFHSKYASKENLDKYMKEAGVENWTQLFTMKWDVFCNSNPEAPKINPWIVVQGKDKNPVIWQRNPYYWAVDSAGNQLPYINEKRALIAGSNERLNLLKLSGENTYAGIAVDVAELAKFQVEQGALKIMTIPSADDITALTLWLNWFSPDEYKRSLIRDKRFRYALSLGIDREMLNQLVYAGFSAPMQIGPSDPTLPWYNEKLANAYLDYDLQTANRLLDEIGLTTRDGDGFRLGPDGKPITFNFVCISHPEWTTAYNIVIEQIAELGLKGNLREIGWGQRRAVQAEAQYDIWGFQDSGFGNRYPNSMGPLVANAYWCGPWVTWLTSNGESGEEPPAIVKETWDLQLKAQTAASVQEMVPYLMKIEDIAAEYLWCIGLVKYPPSLRIYDPALQNLIPTGLPLEAVLWLKD